MLNRIWSVLVHPEPWKHHTILFKNRLWQKKNESNSEAPDTDLHNCLWMCTLKNDEVCTWCKSCKFCSKLEPEELLSSLRQSENILKYDVSDETFSKEWKLSLNFYLLFMK